MAIELIEHDRLSGVNPFTQVHSLDSTKVFQINNKVLESKLIVSKVIPPDESNNSLSLPCEGFVFDEDLSSGTVRTISISSNPINYGM